MPLPKIDRVAKKRLKPEVPKVKEEPAAVPVNVNCLNARGQMRWTHQAVTDLLECHKLAVRKHDNIKKVSDLHKRGGENSQIKMFNPNL